MSSLFIILVHSGTFGVLYARRSVLTSLHASGRSGEQKEKQDTDSVILLYYHSIKTSVIHFDL